MATIMEGFGMALKNFISSGELTLFGAASP
jgi:hypothetical protein